MPLDGLYYEHACSACGSVEYDCLPMRRCQNCLSRDVVVTFDQGKRLRELAEIEANQKTSHSRDQPDQVTETRRQRRDQRKS